MTHREQAPQPLLYHHLFAQAEEVRWRMADIPWAAFSEKAVDDALIESVQAAVTAECTTFQATQRFMTEFYDDVDFTQWVAVWFYEETKHPHVLSLWLNHVGVSVEPAQMLAGRETYPFMSNRVGTLGINVLTEITASECYRGLATQSREPVLKVIAGHLAADEGRHASHFFKYAHQALATSSQPDRDRRALLMILLLIMRHPRLVRHPTSLTVDGLVGYEDTGDEEARIRTRALSLFADLAGFDDLSTEARVHAALRSLRHAQAEGAEDVEVLAATGG